MRDEIREVIYLGYMRIYVERDSAIIIQALRGEIISLWRISNLVTDVEKDFSLIRYS